MHRRHVETNPMHVYRHLAEILALLLAMQQMAEAHWHLAKTFRQLAEATPSLNFSVGVVIPSGNTDSRDQAESPKIGMKSRAP